MAEIAIDLTWVRVGKVGGTESYIRNLLTGIGELDREEFAAFLLLSDDNFNAFKKYGKYKCFRLVRCNTCSSSQIRRVLWQNFHLGRTLKFLGVRKCFEPVYSVPFFPVPKVDFYTTIHDLQALHFPEYCGKIREIWMKMSWKNAVRKSERIISISEFVMKDIKSRYKLASGKGIVIHNPIIISDRFDDEAFVMKKYHIRKESYYYTVSSLFPNKNLITLIKVISMLKEKKSDVLFPLVVSGIEYDAKSAVGDLRKQVRDEIFRLIKKNGLSEWIIFTGFVSDSIRNVLYRNCKAFLFPSIFEGFGMPPVEAMGYGRPVLTTRKTSIPEVTGGIADYVNDPSDPAEYVRKLEQGLHFPSERKVRKLLARYNRKNVAAQYVDIFENCSVNEVYKRSRLPLRKGRPDTHGIARVLIVGSESYIGTNAEKYLQENGKYVVDTLGAFHLNPEPEMFEFYEAVLFVAGIAHRRETRKNAHLYYEINRDLAVKTAEAAKSAHVPYFIVLSSMSVYGMETGCITKDTRPEPKSSYGKSKLQADEAIWKLRDDRFRVAVLRPPMVYGKGCKGNYQPLRKLALAVPVFPAADNKRSMVYIGNLCAFIKGILDERHEGIFFPQNEQYVSTSELVKQIAAANGKKIKMTKIFNPVICKMHTSVVRKIFGSLMYESGDAVHCYGFEDSVSATESRMA